MRTAIIPALKICASKLKTCLLFFSFNFYPYLRKELLLYSSNCQQFECDDLSDFDPGNYSTINIGWMFVWNAALLILCCCLLIGIGLSMCWFLRRKLPSTTSASAEIVEMETV